ncbi:MAG: CotH kinase family protein, partial [Prevotella sp.]|nr:CotH kinase family protein [Prevotella sp.]
ADYRETVLGTDPARHVSDYTYTSSFFTDMWKSKQFVSEVKVRWNRMRPRIMAEFWPEAKRYAEAAAGAMERDARRWPIDRQPKTEINRMEKWLNSRTVFMDNIVTNYPNGN